METDILPLIEFDCSDINNYRPIALVAMALNIFELIIRERMVAYLDTSSNQLGF
jgi:23S rRNA maturation mini-RNase III